MKQELMISTARPIWARDDAFPKAPEGFGWIDRKGKKYAVSSAEELKGAIESNPHGVVDLVWTPELVFLQPPEELPFLQTAILDSRKKFRAEQFASSRTRLTWLTAGLIAFFAWILPSIWSEAGGDLSQAIKSTSSSFTVGVVFLVFVLAGLIPWLSAWRRMKFLDAELEDNARLIRFEIWLEMQKAPVTRIIFGLICCVYLSQIYADGSLFTASGSVIDAGLVKEKYQNGESWRVFTAAFLHGNLLHFVMNSFALFYLGRRLEVLARWPHLPAVFLFSALAGGEASARLVSGMSVGASGGLMGWLGFLLVFETLHSQLIPRRARKRLLSGVLLTAVIGAIGYRFIDNAAHGGGLVAGMLYALVVFPKSSSVFRPKSNRADYLMGGGNLLALLGIAAFAIFKILA